MNENIILKEMNVKSTSIFKKVCIHLLVFLKISMLENEWIKTTRYCNYVPVSNDFCSKICIVANVAFKMSSHYKAF